MLVSMVMVMDRNQLIGANGGLPWHLPGELQYFKKITMGKPLIMGRKTFDSIGRPLPGRTSIVITRDAQWPLSAFAQDSADHTRMAGFIDSGKLRVATNVEQALVLAREVCDASPEVFANNEVLASNEVLESSRGEESETNNGTAKEVAIIGGAAICELALPLVERLYLTVIDAEFEGDTWLHCFKPADWNIVSQTPVSMDGYSLVYQVLERASRVR